MILEQNYLKIAEYTENAFKSYSKRTIAYQILRLIQNKNLQQEAIEPKLSSNLDESVNGFNQLDSEAILDYGMKNLQNEQIKEKQITTNMEISSQKNINNSYVSNLHYGDHINIHNNKGRLYSTLNFLQIITNLPYNYINFLRGCFKLCYPFDEECRREIHNGDMCCFRNMLTNKMITSVTDLFIGLQYGKQLILQNINSNKSNCIFTIHCCNDEKIVNTQAFLIIKVLKLKKNIPCENWNITNINLNIDDQVIKNNNQDNTNYELITNHKICKFRFFKISNINKKLRYPYFKIFNPLNNKYLQGSQLQLNNKIKSSSYNNVEIIDEQNGNKIETISIPINKFDTSVNDEYIIQTSEVINNFNCIWQIKNNLIIHSSSSKIITSSKEENLIVMNYINQNLPKLEMQCQYNQFEYCSKQQKYQYILYPNYGKNIQNHSIDFKSDKGNRQNIIVKFIPLEIIQSKLMIALGEVSDVLLSNYVFFQHWGFTKQKQSDLIKYSLNQLKKQNLILKNKKKQLKNILKRIQQIVLNPIHSEISVRTVVKVLKIMELLILLINIFIIKSDNKQIQNKVQNVFSYAEDQLNGLILPILNLLSLLVFNNKDCSNIVIKYLKLFNRLLLQYPQQVGYIIKSSIHHLNIVQSPDEAQQIFIWIKFIQNISQCNVKLQKIYIDFIAEVIINHEGKAIIAYQNRYKQMLFVQKNNKKIIPKFGMSYKNESTIIFQDDKNKETFFQKNIQLNQLPHQSNSYIHHFLLRNFYLYHTKTIQLYLNYIISIINLFTNLCQNRNRKLLKIMQDWGLTQKHINSVLSSSQIGWELKLTYLNLYTCLYINQDSFLTFKKRSTKCHISKKINEYNFEGKICFLFKQYINYNIIQDKLKQFDTDIEPILDQYLQFILKNSNSNNQGNNLSCFMKFLHVLYNCINLGCLTLPAIKYYTNLVMIKAQHFHFLLQTFNIKIQQQYQKMLVHVCDLIILCDKISIDFCGIHILYSYFLNFENNIKYQTKQQIICICKEALNSKISLRKNSNSLITNGRKSTNKNTISNLRNKSYCQQKNNCYIQFSDESVISFLLKMLLRSHQMYNKPCYNKLIESLELISQKNRRLSIFINQLMILTNEVQQQIYNDFNGRNNSKLFNILKIQQLVQKISGWQYNNNNYNIIDIQEQKRKKQKILQLNNLLVKVTLQLKKYQKSHLYHFEKCQTILEKLSIHKHLIYFIKHSKQSQFIQLIATLIDFYLLFISNHQNNIYCMSEYLPLFLNNINYFMLPKLISQLFLKISNPFQIFKTILQLLQKNKQIKNEFYIWKIINNILSIQTMQDTLRIKIQNAIIVWILQKDQINDLACKDELSLPYVSVLCKVGIKCTLIHIKVQNKLPKQYLLNKLSSKNEEHFINVIYLKLYYYFYIYSQNTTNIECQYLLGKVLMPSLHSLTSLWLLRLSKINKGIEDHQQYLRKQIQLLLSQNQVKNIPSFKQQFYCQKDFIINQNIMPILSYVTKLWNQYSITNNDLFLKLSNYIYILSSCAKILLQLQSIGQIQKNQFQLIARQLEKISLIIFIRQPKQNIKFQKNKAQLSNPINQEIIRLHFQKLVNIICSQNIGYYKLISCSGINHNLLLHKRSGFHRQLYISQQELIKFYHNLNILDQKKLNQLISISNHSRFFLLFSDHRFNKINMYSFMEKLIEVLQYEKNMTILNCEEQKFQPKQNLNQKEHQDFQIYSITNQLIQQQLKQYLSEYYNCFNIDLYNFMKQKIQDKLLSILLQQKFKKNNIYLENWCVNNSYGMLQVHVKHIDSQSYAIVIKKCLEIINVGKINILIVQQYLQFLVKHIIQDKSIILLKIIRNLFSNTVIKQASMVKLYFNIIYKLIKFVNRNIFENKSKQLSINLFEITYELLSQVMEHKNLLQDKNIIQEIEIFIAQSLIQWSQCQDCLKNIYWQTIQKYFFLAINQYFKQCKMIANILSKNKQFKLTIKKVFLQRSNLWILNSNNLDAINSCNLLLDVIKFIIKLKKYQYQEQFNIFINLIPLSVLLQTLTKLQKFQLISNKNHQNDLRQKEFSTNEFSHQNNILDLIFNVLILFQIFIRENQISASNISSFSSYRYLYCKLIGVVELNIHSKIIKIYYKIPQLSQYENQQIQTQIKQQLSDLKSEQIYLNLYLMSSYLQQLLLFQKSYCAHIIPKVLIQFRDYIKVIIIIFELILLFQIILSMIIIPMLFYGLLVNVAIKILYTYYDAQLLCIRYTNYHHKIQISKFIQSSFTVNLLIITISLIIVFWQFKFIILLLLLEIIITKQVKFMIKIIYSAFRKCFYFLVAILALILVSIEFFSASQIKQHFVETISSSIFINLINWQINLKIFRFIFQNNLVFLIVMLISFLLCFCTFLGNIIFQLQKSLFKQSKCMICLKDIKSISQNNKSKSTNYFETNHSKNTGIFLQHQTDVHNVWNYLYYFIYLRNYAKIDSRDKYLKNKLQNGYYDCIKIY